MAADWIKKAAEEIWTSFMVNANKHEFTEFASEVIARNVPQPQILVPQGSAPDAEWKSLPDEQTWYWHWNGEDLSVPFIYQVMASLTGGRRYFVAGGISPWCDEMGGWWLKVERPNVPRRDYQKAALAARDVPQSKPEPKEKV